MKSEKYPILFSPIKVGNITVKNRIFMSAMTTGLCSLDNTVTDAALKYYEARFKGGVGLVTTECTMPHKDSHYSTTNNMGLYDDAQIEGMSRLAKLAHQYDVKIVSQLLHGGPAAVASLNKGKQPIAASAIPLRNVGEMPREMTVDEIHELTKSFGDAAYRAKQAGLDGVEIHSCHRHGVLGTFLSPLSNKRVDDYGGDINGRMKFLLEVIDEVRNRVGKDFVIIVRLSMSEYEPGGQSFLDCIHIARTLEEHGVDMLNLSDATLEQYWKTVTPNGTAKGVNTELASKLRGLINIPIGVIGRNNEPWAAELVLNLGRTDAVYMGRALLCDPEWPNKAREGEENSIRPCIGCTDCIVHAHGPVIRCSMNPFAGREFEIENKSFEKKKILVIGGGAGGMQAAASLANKGHNVTLCERTNRLGGLMYLAGIPIAKQDITQGTKYLINELKKSGADIQLNKEVTIDYVKDLKPDYCILASGSNSIIPKFLDNADQLVDARDVLDGKAVVGENVVVIGGGLVGCETAEFIAHPFYDLSKGSKKVTVIEMQSNLAPEDTSYGRSLLVRRMFEKKIQILLNSKVEEINGRTITYSKDGKNFTIENVDTVVAALGAKPNVPLKEEIENLGIKTFVIGAAVKTGRIYDAIMEAEMVAESI